MRNSSWSMSTLFVPLCSGCSEYDNSLFSSGLSTRIEDCTLTQHAIPAKYISGEACTSV
jgi:hypothetical protein